MVASLAVSVLMIMVMVLIFVVMIVMMVVMRMMMAMIAMRMRRLAFGVLRGRALTIAAPQTHALRRQKIKTDQSDHRIAHAFELVRPGIDLSPVALRLVFWSVEPGGKIAGCLRYTLNQNKQRPNIRDE